MSFARSRAGERSTARVDVCGDGSGED